MLRDALESSGNLARDAESVFQRVLVAVVAASSARKSTSAMPLPVHHAAVAGVGRAVFAGLIPVEHSVNLFKRCRRLREAREAERAGFGPRGGGWQPGPARARPLAQAAGDTTGDGAQLQPFRHCPWKPKCVAVPKRARLMSR